MKRLLILCLPLLVLLLPAQTQGQTTNRAGIVVKFSDGRVQTSCVSFQSESISGLELLQSTGLDVIAQSSGGNAAVCKIGGDGCAFPAEPCFCKMGGGQQSLYWAYWRLNGDAWRYAAQGASSVRVTNGDVDGWAWGTGNVQSGAAPPVTTFDQICPAVQPEPVQPAPEPTAKPAPTARPTAVPVPQPTIAPTARPTVKPTIRPTAPIVAEAPTVTPEPPTATPTTEPTATTLPTAAATITPTATSVPSSTPASTPTSAATPTAADPTPTPPTATSGSSDAGSYLIFGTLLAGLMGAIGVAQWRRRR